MRQVAEVMTHGVRSLSPYDSIVAAARTMEELDIGVVPVCSDQQLVGLVTDRDLVVRGLAQGRAAESTPLDQVMSREPQWCYEDQSIDEVLEQMREARIRRVPVLNRSQRLVGMLSLGDVAVKSDGDGAGIVLQEVSEPAQPAQAPDGVAAEADAEPQMVGSGADAATAADAAADTEPDEEGRTVTPRRPAGRTVWVLVADEAIARILQKPERDGELVSVEELTDPTAHAKEGDLHDDADGRRAGSATHSARPNTPHRVRSTANVTSSAGEDQRHLEAQGFARRVAQHLGEALRQRRYDELHVVAAPRFLGHLRKAFDAHVSATVAGELNKDLVHERNADITERLFPSNGGPNDTTA